MKPKYQARGPKKYAASMRLKGNEFRGYLPHGAMRLAPTDLFMVSSDKRT